MAYTTIDDPSAYFHTQLHTGTGSAQTVTNDANAGDFKPDWIWVKNRDDTDSHMLSDSNRGSTSALSSQDSIVEFTPTNGDLAFLTDGYSFGSNNNYNRSDDKFVAWQWIANGGTTTTNDASATGVGDQDSVYQANTTAGFSIVTYTGTGSDNEDYAHGLGASPELIIIKARDATTGWSVNHISKGMTSGYLQLQANSAFASASNNVKAVSSTTFRLGVDSWVNGSGVDFVGYFFKSIQGYSKFGSYTGNNNADGPFVYTGFKPAFVIIKAASRTGEWVMLTGKIATVTNSNPLTDAIYAHTNAAETGTFTLDFLSNGFKIKHTSNATNGNGETYIYMAFAESPFVSSKGVSVTAR